MYSLQGDTASLEMSVDTHLQPRTICSTDISLLLFSHSSLNTAISFFYLPVCFSLFVSEIGLSLCSQTRNSFLWGLFFQFKHFSNLSFVQSWPREKCILFHFHFLQTPGQSPGDHRSLTDGRDQSMGADRWQTWDSRQRQPLLWSLPQDHEHTGASAAALW